MHTSKAKRFYKWVKFPYWDHWLLDVARPDTLRLDVILADGRRIVDPPPAVAFRVVQAGKPMDFGSTPMGLPVASPRARELLRRQAPSDVQLIPCRIDGVDNGYCVVNIVSRLDCVDLHRSKLIIPAMGSAGAMHGWIIDADKAGDHAVFRLDNEPTTIVLSEALKREIERQQLIGPGLVELDGEELNNVMPGFGPAGRSRKDSTGRR